MLSVLAPLCECSHNILKYILTKVLNIVKYKFLKIFFCFDFRGNFQDNSSLECFFNPNFLISCYVKCFENIILKKVTEYTPCTLELNIATMNSIS